MKKAFSLVFVSFLCSALLFSQSLVEIAKKEKERREQFKGKNVKVITNADLKQTTKKPAVATASASPTQGAIAQPNPSPSDQESEAQTLQETQQIEPSYQENQPPGAALAVLPDTLLVENPELALYRPDGKYAEISIMGFLDLEFSANNGPGDDIAIHARRAGGPDQIPAGQEEGGFPVGLQGNLLPGTPPSYGVLVMGDQGDWEAIGRGVGIKSPEKFDLGSIRSIKKIRIIFKYETNPDLAIKRYKFADSREFTMGIDAVEALH
jgi:hypothetical protein